MKWEIHNLELTDVKIIVPRRFADPRGWLCENYSRSFFAEQLSDVDFTRDVTSFSHAGVLRGLHYEAPGNVKLVRVVQGRIWDVVVDIRHRSDTFGNWQRVELDADQDAMLYVPLGFAHAYYSLEDSVVLYKISGQYDSDAARTILWNDQELSIDWPAADPLLSEGDRQGVTLRQYLQMPDY